MFIKKIIIISILFLFLAGYVQSDNSNQTAGAFLRIGPGARPLGMGKSYVAIANDVMGTYWNPAGMAFLRGTQVGFFYMPRAIQLKYMYATFVQNIGSLGTFGVSMTALNSSDIQGRDENEVLTDLFIDSETAISFSYGMAPAQNLAVGLNAKLIMNSLEAHKGSGMGFDAGFQYRPYPFFAFGFKAQDVFSSITWDTQSARKETIPMVLTPGVALTFKRITLSCDYELFRGEGEIHAGGELRLFNFLSIRLGYDGESMTFGLNLNSHLPMRGSILRTDYCSTQDAVTQNGLNGFSLAFSISKANAPNRPPIAIPGENKSAKIGEVVSIIGAGKDEDKDDTIQNYSWRQIAGSPVEISDYSNSTISFTPAEIGTYIFDLQVGDGKVKSEPEKVTIEVASENALNTENFPFGEKKLSWKGSHSNAECIIVEDSTMSKRGSYVGHFNNIGAKVFESATIGESRDDFSVSAKFYLEKPWNNDLVYRGFVIRAENVEGEISKSKSVKAYRYAFVRDGRQIKLDYFTDSWHDIKTFQKGKDYILNNSNWHTLRITLIGNKFYPSVDGNLLPGSPYADDNSTFTNGYVGICQYLKSGNRSNSCVFDDFIITEPNQPPTSNAGKDAMAYANQEITLDGSGTDPENAFLTYKWKQISGPTVTLSDNTAAKPTFEPSKSGIYKFQLIVNDGKDSSLPSKVTVLMRNIRKK
ncbi:MAG: PorV/PorQ family protein [Candidatus Cloacimonadota bacterium]|nr:PorV/PorQ family protein [Candidatus Cloacimonadota bacterium]